MSPTGHASPVAPVVHEPPYPLWVREPEGFRRRVSRAIRVSGCSHREKAELLQTLIDHGAGVAWREFKRKEHGNG